MDLTDGPERTARNVGAAMSTFPGGTTTRMMTAAGEARPGWRAGRKDAARSTPHDHELYHEL